MPRARKTYPCEYGRDCTIQPGESYHREVYPPWTLVADDPDGPGSPLGHWAVERYHGHCYADMLYGGQDEHDAAVRADEADAQRETQWLAAHPGYAAGHPERDPPP